MPKNKLKYNLSYWEREVFFQKFDVVVIGSGLVGLSAALTLLEQSPKLSVAVLERGPLPVGASTRNAGFACFGSMTELLDDLDQREEEGVWALVEKRWEGLRRLRQRLGDERTGFRQFGGYEVFRDDEEEQYAACMDHRRAFNQRLAAITGEPETFRPADSDILRFGFSGVSHLIRNVSEGQLHTGKMIEALWQMAARAGVRIFTGLNIERIEGHSQGVSLVTEPGWELTASRAIVATNGFAQALLPEVPVAPARNQVMVTKPVPGLPVEGCFHYDRGYYYFRNIDGRILLGGGRNLAHAVEATTSFGTTELIRGALTRLLREVILPGRPVEVDSWWSGILGVGEVKHPIVQWMQPNVLAAVRLGGMGVAIGTLVGEEAAEKILET